MMYRLYYNFDYIMYNVDIYIYTCIYIYTHIYIKHVNHGVVLSYAIHSQVACHLGIHVRLEDLLQSSREEVRDPRDPTDPKNPVFKPENHQFRVEPSLPTPENCKVYVNLYQFTGGHTLYSNSEYFLELAVKKGTSR